MGEERIRAYTQEDLLRAFELIQRNRPELFARLVRSEVENRPELRDDGMSLIIALEGEGFKYDHFSLINMAGEFRRLILEEIGL